MRCRRPLIPASSSRSPRSRCSRPAVARQLVQLVETRRAPAAPQTQAQIQEENPELVRFADCMHSHGVSNFPDPTNPHAFKQAMNPNDQASPAFGSAMTACQHLLPNGGQPSQSAPPSQAQITDAAGVRTLPPRPRVPQVPGPEQQRRFEPRDAHRSGDQPAAAGSRAGSRRVRRRHARVHHQGRRGPLRRGPLDHESISPEDSCAQRRASSGRWRTSARSRRRSPPGMRPRW